MQTKHSKRIDLLSDIEVTELYARPNFNIVEQELYFSLNLDERSALECYSHTRTQVYFILQLGYFKAKHQFFSFEFEQVSHDVNFILKTYFSKPNVTLSGCLSRSYIRSQKHDLLKLFNYRHGTSDDESKIESHICKLLRYYPKSHDTVRQLLNYFDHQELVIPSYRTLQDMFTNAYSIEENRLNQIILSFPADRQKQLSAMILHEDGNSQLNTIRADQKDFKFTAVRAEIEKAQNIVDLYEFSKKAIPTLKLSNNIVRNYADLTEQYAPYRLRLLNKHQQSLHVICFVYHRYQQIADNLIISFLYHTRAILDAGKIYADKKIAEHNSRRVVDFPQLAKFLNWFPSRSKTLNHIELNHAAYNILPEEKFSTLAKFIDGAPFDKKAARWKYYLKSARFFSLYLRPIMMTLSFDFYKENSQLMELVNLLKTHYLNQKSPSKLDVCDNLSFDLPKSMIKYLKKNLTDTHLNPHLFEFFVYKKMYHHIGRGRLFCNDSITYCDIDYELIDDALVDDVEEIAVEFGYSKIPIYCEQHLDGTLQELRAAWERTTKNINSNNNSGFKVKKTEAGLLNWNLTYDSIGKLDDTFFRKLPKVEISNIVKFIGDLTDMWNEFTHMKDRYVKHKKPIPRVLNACLLSEAFGFSVLKMADMSDLTLSSLRSTREDFVRIDTLCLANDIVSNQIKTLPIFKQWNLMDDKLLADADGQKIATTDSTIQSRYSKKHFGKGRGLSIYTLSANFVAVNARNIGLNEYEGHSLYDMIYGNKTDIEIHMVTGDNHSLNKLNFVVLDSIDVDYVPSIKNIRRAADELYAAYSQDSYEGLIQPKKVIDIDLIRSQRRGIMRILLSLIMQENTQSNIIRKLNSHARYARLKAALFEYNSIFKSIHVLNLIDDMPLRKALKNARNRTEAYHQLQSSIRKTYRGVFQGKRVVENRVSAHATRLIANCIIAYNSMILNAVYEKMLADGVSQEIIDKFTRISPIAWTHALLTGCYNFKKGNKNIDLDIMTSILEAHLKQHFWQ